MTHEFEPPAELSAELRRAFDELGDGPGGARLARQRARLIEWERARTKPVPFGSARALVLAVSFGALCSALVAGFGARWLHDPEVAHAVEGTGGADSAAPQAVALLPKTAVPPKTQAAGLGPSAGEPEVLTARVGGQPARADQWVQATTQAVTLAFSDASEIELRAGTRARISELGAAGLDLALEAGHLDARITPGGGRRWLIHAGPFQVAVVGTVFSVDWVPERGELAVGVTRGKVEVSGGNAETPPRLLVAGETLRVSSGSAKQPAKPSESDVSGQLGAAKRKGVATQAALERSSDKPSAAESGALPSSLRNGSSATQTDVGEEREDWKRLAEHGDYAKAFSTAERTGLDALMASSSASDLLLLADAARLSGATDAARRVLSALRERYPKHANALVAGFVLGRIAFEANRDAEAIRWFRVYLAEGGSGPLAEGARARLLLALRRSGDTAAAKVAAAEYLKHHPEGRQAGLARELLSE